MELPYQKSNLYWSFHFFAALLICSGSTISRDETLSLLAFKEQISDDPLGALASWNNTTHYCRWRGITCSHQHRRVEILDLEGLSLHGNINPHIANLTYLTKINLGHNHFVGKIPQEIGQLFRLQYLWLEDNSLQGTIPTSLSRCTEFVSLKCDYNSLTGRLPFKLGYLSKLSVLSLENNALTGKIPHSYTNLSSLTLLTLNDNFLHGSIPKDLGQLVRLLILRLGPNHLSGIIPSSIYNITGLFEFSVTNNQLVGKLPPDIGLTLPNLVGLFMNGNKFRGSIPLSLMNASSLVNLELSNNHLDGSVPLNLGSLRNLNFLNLGFNELMTSRTDGLSFLTSLVNCSNLETLYINFNTLKGELLESVGNLSTQLKYFELFDNQFSGSIPAEIGNLVGLTGMDFSYNSFSGSIPPEIGKLNQLQILYLSQNRLLGEIPSSIGNLTKLNELYFDGNGLWGSIPESFGECHLLQALNLSQNNLNGTIPRKLMSLPSLSISLSLASNYLTGSLPSEVGSLKNLEVMDISSNNLSGDIPSALGSCVKMEYLRMAGNYLQGRIPSSLGDLKGIQVLDLSRNNLSGQIPKSLEKLSLLLNLNLSFNNLQGEVPKEGIFRNISAVSVLRNKNLCGGVLELHLPACPVQAIKRQHSVLLKILVPLLCLFFFLCFIVVVYWRTKSKRKLSTTSSLKEKYRRVSYAELLKATDGFSSSNLIGVGSFGSVYKGTLDNGETLVAVKVLNLQQQGASKSFNDECKALRSIRHRNLVKILTSCSSMDFKGNDFKALVFEFMPNGSLEKWLHNPVRSLSLIQRLNIAIDVASALDYLHNQCQIPIVHCDLKPSNVLLDTDMTAHVGDFGLAKLSSATSGGSSRQQTSTAGLKGSIGYIAPEYGMGGEVSIHGDVYSYGILLLEMFTGKTPTDDMFNGDLSLHKFAKIALPERVMEVVDPRLLIQGEDEAINTIRSNTDMRGRMHLCLVSVIRIAVTCSLESSSERMGMNDVTTELHSIRDVFLGVGVHQERGNRGQERGEGPSHLSNY